nr:FAD-dependent oxidoreductase [Tepidamorphus gemmatus]
MLNELTPDICVIGAGAAGLSVAAAAAAFGVPVVLVERGAMGGDCLNVGCVPSKALIAAGRRAQEMREATAFGITAVEPQLNFRRVNNHLRGVIAGIGPTDSEARFRAMGVTVIKAEARFLDRSTVVAGETRIRARRFVVATGSRPAIPAIPGLATVDYHTNETIFSITRKPVHLIVVGAGPIGLEIAQAMRRLGSEVTVIEAGTPLGHEDPELVAVVLERLRREGVSLRTGMAIRRVEPRRSGVRVILAGADTEVTVDGSDLLIAAGRQPVTDGLALDAAGIIAGPAGIKVNSKLRTTNRRVYALGDVIDGPRFTHVASYQAGIVIRNILFRLGAKTDYGSLPRVTYCDPELAQVGLTEAEARRRRRTIRVVRWPYAENDRARAERHTEGHIKVIAAPNGRILGVGICGENAGEIIQPWVLALQQGLDLKAMAGLASPYPTLTEIGRRAALEFYRPRLTSPWVRRIIALLRRLG